MTRRPAAAKSPPPPPPRWQVAAAEFWAGFIEPSRTALATLAAVFVIAMAGLLWLFSPASLSGPFGAYLPRHGKDAAGFATVEALRLGRTPASGGRVLIVGSSTLGQAFGDGEAIEKRLPDPWEVHVLSTPLQSPLDQFALLETALGPPDPDGPPVIVVLGIGLPRFAWNAERLLEPGLRGRLGLRSDWEDAEVTRIGGIPELRSGLWLFDNLDFAILNGPQALARTLLQRAPARRPDPYAEGPPVAPAERLPDTLREQIDQGAANRTFYLDMHRRLAERLRARPGTRLVLLEETLAPDLISAFGLDGRAAAFADEIAAYAHEIGAAYWPLTREADLTPEDYYDALHVLRGPPQARLREGLARRLNTLIPEMTS